MIKNSPGFVRSSGCQEQARVVDLRHRRKRGMGDTDWLTDTFFGNARMSAFRTMTSYPTRSLSCGR